MLRALVCLMLALQSLPNALSTPEGRVTLAMKSGILLRMHVVAQDDSEEMQQIKLAVRDAVRQTYDERCPAPSLSMLRSAQDMLPELTEAAQTAALAEGFTGEVTVAIETLAFDDRELDGCLLPAGEYPALMIRMGDARGRNWWGLIDPDLSLSCAAVDSEPQEGLIQWDWSLQGFLAALLGLPMTAQEDADA